MPAGVSVVIASYRGAESLTKSIASLDAQTLTPDRFEAVVVVNGPAARDLTPFEAMRRRFPRLAIRILATETAGASLAWNLGIQAAQMEWLTLLDDDDGLTPTFLGALLDLAGPGVVPLAEIHDVHADGRVERDSRLNSLIRRRAGRTVSGRDFPQAFGFNASKLIPAVWARGERYPHHLTNGQDVVFFGSLSQHHDVVFAVVHADSGAAYLRHVADRSMSRQPLSYDFSIEQRLDVVEILDRVRCASPLHRRRVAEHLIEGQVSLMKWYLIEHPERRADARASIAGRSLSTFPYRSLERTDATRLVRRMLTRPGRR